MKRAFTLLELLTVIAIMGILGSAAVASYSAVTRGMAERGALDAAANISELTRLKSKVDRCRTYLFLYTEVLSADTDDEVANVSGLAIAVKATGRISAVDGTDWFDEFGDLDQEFLSLRSPDGSELDDDDYERASTKFRLFNLNQKEFAVVRNGVRSTALDEPDLEDETPAGSGNFRTHKVQLFGWRKTGGNASFKVGEEYGREFSAVKLPLGFAFGKGKSNYTTSDIGLKFVDCQVFDTDSSGWSPDVYRRTPKGDWKKVEN